MQTQSFNSCKPIGKISSVSMGLKTSAKKEVLTIPIGATQLLKRKEKYISLNKSTGELSLANLKSRLI